MGERGIVGGTQTKEHAVGEEITWTLNVGNVGSAAGAVTNPDMTVTRLSDGVDVTVLVTTGAMIVAGQIITLMPIGGVVGAIPPAPASLDEGEQYRVDVIYDKDGHVNLKNEFKLACPDVEP